MWVEAEVKSHSDDVELIIDCAYGLGAIGVIVKTPFVTDGWDLGTYLESQTDLHLVVATFEAPFQRSDRTLLRRRLNRLALRKSPPRIRYEYIQDRDFSNEWRKFFSVQQFGRLRLRPSWISEEAVPDQIEMILDPGFAFGSGLHATTQLCLELLERNLSNQTRALTVIDVGTGSGILSIAAALLGASQVRAYDIDCESIEIAKANARLNCVSDLLAYEIFDFSKKLSKDFFNTSNQADLIVANISHIALVSMMHNFSCSIKLGGQLIISGFGPTAVDELVAVGTEAGFELYANVSRDQWCALMLTRKF